MDIVYHPKFKKEYRKLPARIKNLAEKKEVIFRKNPFDRRLKTHKLHGELATFYAWAINAQYRIMFDFAPDGTARFYFVGTHDVY